MLKTAAWLCRQAGGVFPLVISFIILVPSAAADKIHQSRGFRKHVTLGGIREHQAAFQSFSNANGGNRVSGTGGFDDSAEYVRDRVLAAGYEVTVQEFTFSFVGDQTPPVLERVSPTPKNYVDGTDFATMSYSGSGDVTASLWAVDLKIPPSPVGPPDPGYVPSTSGCESSDFAGFPPGAVALIQRGTCTFRVKAENALAAGASGVIIFNEGNPGRTGIIFGTLSPPQIALPVVGSTFALGDELRNGVVNGPTGVTVHLEADVIAEDRPTRNVIAETPGGNPHRVVVIGAHLDSVTRGPGINDNGSGSGTILEVAEQLARRGDDDDDGGDDDGDDDDADGPRRFGRNKLRFIWFGAEEFGLIGSQHYVDQLSDTERDNILAMLNFDMVGSPNFVRFVYDGDGSAGASPPGPPGSAFIEQVFLDYFKSQRLATEPTPFDGRSDYGPFIQVGIPAGGLFTGAEGVKTPAQAVTYGGTAGIQYDPCYHLACDTFDNFSRRGLDQMADAAAHAVLFFAKTKADVRTAPPTARALSASAGLADTEYEGHLLRK